MRFDLTRAKPETLFEALTMLHYVSVNSEASEWRHGKYHLLIRKKRKKGLTLNIHVDSPSPFPPFHRARHKGRDLELEVQRILDAYIKRRSAQQNFVL
jgi:hypothetical protein